MTLRASFVTDALSILDKSSTTSYQGVSILTIARTSYATVLNMMARTYNFAALLDEDTSVSTASDTVTYTLPSNTNRIFRIVYEKSSSSVVLNGMSPRKFDCKYPYPGSLSSGTPSDYTRRNDSTFDICVPPAYSTLVLRIYRSVWPTADATTDCQLTHMDDIVVAGMVADLYHMLSMDSEANTWWQKFRQKMDVAWTNDSNYPDMHNVATQFTGSDAPYYAGDGQDNPFVKYSR